MKRKEVVVIIVAVVVLIATAIVLWPRRYEATFYPMGGIPFKIVCYGRNMFQFDGDLSAVEDVVTKLEGVFNRYRKLSEISQLNSSAAVAPVAMSSEFARAFALSQHWYKVSGKAFDPTVGPLVGLWKEAGQSGILPTPYDVQKVKELVGLNGIAISSRDRILFSKQGMSLDFGAIAKGLIVDEAVDALKNRGVGRGVVDAGGDGYAFGDGEFRFGIQDPTAGSGERLLGTVDVMQGAVVTSGNYERYVEIDGKRYSHIIDPRTGYPVENALVSATVIGGDAAGADALATALMVLGVDDGISLLKNLGDFEALFIKKIGTDYEVYASEKLAGRLRLDGEWATRRIEEF